ncbi:MAG: hypothetical protein RIT28_2691 [Pseudomonadota bacterium]
MTHAYGLWSLAPAAAAIILALATRNVVLSLFSATWLAGTLIVGGDPLAGLWKAVDPFMLDALASRDHMKVTLFSLFVGAMVGVMTRAGGTRALVEWLVRLASGRRGAMTASWLAGMIVFFDDYANCLIVGNTMRPLCDRLRVSREKLSYIVDSTAAPVASLALVSTWIGYEVGLMEEGLKAAGVEQDAYAFFIEGMGYRFYSIFTIVFVGAIAMLGRDFGPMLAAERRVAAAPEIEPDEGAHDAPPAARGLIAAAPVLTLVLVTFFVLWRDGRAAAPEATRIFEILGAANGYDAMLKSSLAGLICAGALAALSRALSFGDIFEAGLKGAALLFDALVVLFLAWSLGSGINALDAAGYLIGALQSSLAPELLPTLVFLLCAAISFATGTSFGTMAIVMPLVVPLSFAISDDPLIPLIASGAVLSGACWGDHCSPISDTTVLSSVGTRCDLMAHVRTQMPYAIVVGVISVVFGTLPAGYGVSPWLLLPLGAVACAVTLRLFGKTAESSG